MRLSSIQKDVLFVLYAIEHRGNINPIPNMQLLTMINKSRTSKIFDTNFRASAHKLNEHGMINKYYSSSLKLAWSLTDNGRDKAGKLFKERLKEAEHG